MTQTALTTVVVATLVFIALAIVAWTFVRWRRSINKELRKVLRTLSSESLVNFVIPDGTGGEIYIDHLLLTPHGLMLLETKDMQGAVFAGDYMDTWSVNLRGARLTFNNPIPMLHARAAAIRLLAPGVPLESRVLFINEATFPKGHPSAVSTVPALIEEYAAIDSAESPDFSAHWQTIKSAAVFDSSA